jgi:D-glycero-alpha-D-manno-heptose-7-phosphate kinase
MLPITTQAPARIDLAGGTLDIWPLYLFHENSQTINFAIDCYARCRITGSSGKINDKRIVIKSLDLKRSESFASLDALRRSADAGRLKLALPALLIREFQPQGGFTLEMESGVPAGSGLGGSSALNIAICGALSGLKTRFHASELSSSELIEIARNVESQVLRVPAGEQDYYSAMYGGLQAIHLTPHGIVPERLPVDEVELNARFVLCYTGQSRHSGINNWEVEKAHIDGQRTVVRHFANIARIAAELREALIKRDWRGAGQLVNSDWQARKRAWPRISTPQIDKLITTARRSGALAGKACGAGGGGCVAFLVEPEAKAKVEEAIAAAGGRLMPAKVSPQGLQARS